jgi:hypothetical protein
LNVKRTEDFNRRGGKNGEGMGGEENQSMLHRFVWRQPKDTHQIQFLKGKEERGG